jgi:hypothetical protein
LVSHFTLLPGKENKGIHLNTTRRKEGERLSSKSKKETAALGENQRKY